MERVGGVASMAKCLIEDQPVCPARSDFSKDMSAVQLQRTFWLHENSRVASDTCSLPLSHHLCVGILGFVVLYSTEATVLDTINPNDDKKRRACCVQFLNGQIQSLGSTTTTRSFHRRQDSFHSSRNLTIYRILLGSGAHYP